MLNKVILRTILGILFPLLIAAIILWAKFVRLPLPCVIYSAFGVYCSSCGGTRAVIALANGDITAALRNNLFVSVMAIPSLLLFLRLWIGFVFNLTFLYNVGKKTLYAICIFAVIFLVYGIIRNIPCYPFTYLVPIK